MNGYECGQCDQSPCVCKEVERNHRISSGIEVIETAANVFATMPRWRRLIIKLLWPEIRHIREALNEFYGKEG